MAAAAVEDQLFSPQALGIDDVNSTYIEKKNVSRLVRCLYENI